MVTLLYGSGLRLLECCRLRVKDIDLGRHQMTVRSGKGDRDRVVPLPATSMTQERSNKPLQPTSGGRAVGESGSMGSAARG